MPLTLSKEMGKAVCIHSDPKGCCHTKTAHSKQRAFVSRKGKAGQEGTLFGVVALTTDFVTEKTGFLLALPVLGCLLKPCKNFEIAGWVQQGRRGRGLRQYDIFQT